MGALIGSPWSADGWDSPKGSAEVGCDRYRVVGGDTGPRVPHTSHVFGDKETLMGPPELQVGDIPPPRSSCGRLSGVGELKY